MSIVSLTTAKAQRRITTSAEDELLQGYLDAAEAHCARYLNRNLYADDAALAAAKAAAPATLQSAYDAYLAAETTYTAITGPTPVNDLVWAAAQADWNAAREAAGMTLCGLVANDPVKQAIVLLFGGWEQNREYVNTETPNAVELPLGVESLLFPFRARLGV